MIYNSCVNKYNIAFVAYISFQPLKYLGMQVTLVLTMSKDNSMWCIWNVANHLSRYCRRTRFGPLILLWFSSPDLAVKCG